MINAGWGDVVRFALIGEFLEEKQEGFTLWERYWKVNGILGELESHVDIQHNLNYIEFLRPFLRNDKDSWRNGIL